MDAAPLRYLLIEDGRPTGPHSLAVLRQKAELRVINRDTPVAFSDAPDNWIPLHQLEVLSEELFPAPTTFTLGTKTIETINQSGAGAPPTVHEILAANLSRQQAATGELLTPHPPRSNKRRNDYLILAGGLNAIIAILLLQGAPPSAPFLVSLLSLFAMGNIGLVWVMFFVMDRY